MKSHNLDTTNWHEFPFSVGGVNFISKLAPESPFLPQVNKLPAGVFESMNRDAVKDLIGEYKTMEDLIDSIATINEGATHAVIEVA